MSKKYVDLTLVICILISVIKILISPIMIFYLYQVFYLSVIPVFYIVVETIYLSNDVSDYYKRSLLLFISLFLPMIVLSIFNIRIYGLIQVSSMVATLVMYYVLLTLLLKNTHKMIGESLGCIICVILSLLIFVFIYTNALDLRSYLIYIVVSDLALIVIDIFLEKRTYEKG